MWRVISAWIAVGILAPLPALAEPYKATRNKDGLTVSPVATIGDVQPQLINGKDVTLAAFPASFYATFEISELPECTATLIGPRVILTAAHCVGHKKTISVKAGSRIISGPCYHHPGYARNDSADFAVCRMKRAIPGVKAERVSIVAPQINENVLLAGYGCTNRDLRRSGSGKFKIGFALVVGEAGSDPKLPHFFMTDGSRAREAPASVCPGDSGGAVFCLGHDLDLMGKRSVCGLNSAADCAGRDSNRECIKLSTTSYLSSLRLVSDWLKKTAVQPICGLDPSIDALCRD
jgi:hypothetical protein